VLTKSIRLTDEEASELDDVVQQSGEVEASVLKRAALRGLREDRVDRAVLLYLRGASTSEAATFARVPRARFIDLLADKGVAVLEGPSSLPEELDAIARLTHDKLLGEVAAAIRGNRGPLQPSPARRELAAVARESGRRRRPRPQKPR
jgi:hypothetical protein